MLMRCWPTNPYCMQIMFNSQFKNKNPQIEYYLENLNFIIHLSARLNVHRNQLLQKQKISSPNFGLFMLFFFFFFCFNIKLNFQLICSLFLVNNLLITRAEQLLLFVFVFWSVNWIMSALSNLNKTFVPFAGERISIESFWWKIKITESTWRTITLTSAKFNLKLSRSVDWNQP